VTLTAADQASAGCDTVIRSIPPGHCPGNTRRTRTV
jgi:hypothetical protein